MGLAAVSKRKGPSLSTAQSAIETANYLARLPAAEQTKAVAYTQGGHWLLLWSWLATLAVCWLAVRSGALDKISRRLNKTKSRANLTVFACVASFSLLRWLLTLPWTGYADWGREKAYGMTRQPFADWLTQGLIQAIISAIFSGLLFVAVYLVIRRTGRAWALWAMGVAGLFCALGLIVAPMALQPIFNHYTLAPAGPVRDAVSVLARENGVSEARIFVYDGSRQSNRFTANVTGLGSTSQIALSDTMFEKGASLDEIRAVVGHEIGHYRAGHLWILTLVLTALFGIGFQLIGLLFGRTAALFGLTGSRLHDPVAFPVVTALIATLTMLGTPLIYAAQRAIENDADTYSLEHVRLPDALASALIKSADYRASSPSRLEEALFYDHPSVAHRVRKAMDWKAEHNGR